MTKIDPSTDLINALRAQLTARSSGQKSEKSDRASSPAQSDANEQAMSPGAVKQRIGRLIKHLDLKSSAERRYARKIFLESVITWDLGEEILSDRRFEFVVQDVEDALSHNPTLSASFDKLLEDLQETSNI